MTKKTPQEIPKPKGLAGKIERLAVELLEPMEAEMLSKRWDPAFRLSVWEAIARKALERAKAKG